MYRLIKCNDDFSFPPHVQAYYDIMNLLDDAALANRKLTPAEIKKLDDLFVKSDTDAIEDIADANDCYTPDGELCATWDEMVVALRGLFDSGDRGPVGSFS